MPAEYFDSDFHGDTAYAFVAGGQARAGSERDDEIRRVISGQAVSLREAVLLTQALHVP